MPKGFWNYTEPIFFRVVLVRLYAVKEPPMYWQNAFINQERQAVEISLKDQKPFYIDNGDGSGLQKIQAGGGPGSMSRHIAPQSFEIIAMIDRREEWKQWDPHACQATDEAVEAWQKQNHPLEFERLQALKRSWAGSDMNPRGKNFKFKR